MTSKKTSILCPFLIGCLLQLGYGQDVPLATNTTTTTTSSTPSADNTTTTTTLATTTTAEPTFPTVLLKAGTPQTILLPPETVIELSLDAPGDPGHSFWIFEGHTQYYGIILTPMPPPPDADITYTFGVDNHPGLVVFRPNTTLAADYRPKVYLMSLEEHRNVTVLLLVRGYSEQYPVPGFDDEAPSTIGLNASPSLNVSWTENLVRLRFIEAGHLSNNNNISQKSMTSLEGQEPSERVYRYRVYEHFMDERDFDETNYLTHLSSFLIGVNDDDNDANFASRGYLVSDSFVRRNVTHRQNEVIFAAYPGTAAIYTVAVTTSQISPNGSQSSFSTFYVTSSTYSCNLDETLPLNCKVMWLTITKIVCGVSVFVGIFMAFLGHRYFQLTQFFFGLFSGYFIGYILVENFANMDHTGTLGLSAGISVFFAVAWSCLWFFCGIPLLATVLPTAVLGLLSGASLVFVPALNIVSLVSDATYWGSIAAFTLGIPLVLLGFTRRASIISCAVIGTYAIITPLDHYIGSSLKFILVNVVRRATVEDFNLAVIYYPFQINDIALLIGWIGLIIMSCIVQQFRERNRAPFPPNMFQQWRWRREERNFLNENDANAATETSPLLYSRASGGNGNPAENHAYMSPRRLNAPLPARSNAMPTASGETPVVGYIEGYGSSTVPSPIYRAAQMPEFYERRLTNSTNVRSAAPSARRQLNTATPAGSASGISSQHLPPEESDIFRPPDH